MMSATEEAAIPGVAAEDPPFGTPALSGRHVCLRQVGPEDYQMLRAVELSGERLVRWRFRGASVSPERWAQTLWEGILSQFIVVATETQRPLGLVMAYRANLSDGHAYFAVENFAAPQPSPLTMMGAALHLEYLFTCWPLRKLYLEVTEYNLDQFASGVGRLFEVEGRLHGHCWYRGRRWDQIILALYRERWLTEGRRVLQAATQPAAARVRLPPRGA